MDCKLYKKVVCFGLAVIMACSAYVCPLLKSPVAFAGGISESKSKQSDLQSQNEELNGKLNKLKKNESEQIAYKETLDAQIKVVEQQISEANSQIVGLDKTIKELEDSIDQLQKEIDKKSDKLKQRLRAVYKAGETSTLDIILGAKDFSDFLDKIEIVKTVSEHDSGLISTLQRDMNSINVDKAKVEESRSEIVKNKAILDAKQAELAELIDEIQRVLKKIEGEKKEVLDQIDENDSEIQRINAEIAEYYEQQKAAANSSSSSSSSGSSSNDTSNSSSGSSNNDAPNSSSGSSNSQSTAAPSGSRYIWPVPGFYELSSPYGEYDPIRGGRKHLGIDIAGSGINGSRIVAAASGRVISSGYGGGYGNCVVIDHGNGRSTLYAHMSKIAVSTGQTVSQGQVIGYVGSTGHSTGPHLHFETRLYGDQYDPQSEY